MNRTLIKFLATRAAYCAPDDTYAVDMATINNPVARTLVARYTEFSGSADNAANLVVGLRTGSPVTLRNGNVSLIFMPWGGGMSWDSVDHTLSLARLALMMQGIANPTAEELLTALTGRSITPELEKRRQALRPAGRQPVRSCQRERYCSGVTPAAWVAGRGAST